MTLETEDRAALLDYQKLSTPDRQTGLLTRFAGAIGTAVNAYRTAGLPMVVLELEGKRLAAEAFKEWKPGGMAPASYVTTYVKQRLQRYVIEHQNVARLPEGQAQFAAAHTAAVAHLTDKFERPPSAMELSDYLRVPVAKITAARKLIRPERLSSGVGEDFEASVTAEDLAHASVMYYQFTPLEQNVFDYALGAHGHPALSNNEIAGKLGVTAGRVSNIRAQLAKKLKTT